MERNGDFSANFNSLIFCDQILINVGPINLGYCIFTLKNSVPFCKSSNKIYLEVFFLFKCLRTDLKIITIFVIVTLFAFQFFYILRYSYFSDFYFGVLPIVILFCSCFYLVIFHFFCMLKRVFSRIPSKLSVLSIFLIDVIVDGVYFTSRTYSNNFRKC